MNAQTTEVLLIVVTILVAGYAVFRTYQQGDVISLPGVVTELKEAQPIAQQLIDVATVAVQAAEQLKNTGKLPNNSAAFEYSLDYVKRWLPGGAEVSNADIEAAIESAVLVANSLTAQIKGSK